ncbi:MAG: MMPL family transporter [Candidatus Heimdallarchaeaceae archaeon]
MSFISYYHRFIAKYKILIIIFWLVVAGFGIWLGPKFLDNTGTNFESPEDTESYVANKIFEEEFGSIANETNVIVVIRNNEGSVLTAETEQYVTHLIQMLNESEFADTIVGVEDYYTLIKSNLTEIALNYVSENSQTMLMIIHLNYTDIDRYYESITYIRNLVKEENSLGDSYFVGVTGFSLLFQDMQKGTENDLKRMDSIVLPIALLVLAIILRSARLLFIPLVVLGISIFTSFLIMYPIALNFTVFAFVPSVMMSITIAVSIDYGLFLLTRYREEIFQGKTNDEAVKIMSQNAGHTIMVSGLTLVITFIGLAFFPLDLLITMGLGSAISVLCTLLVNLTFTPAMLLTFGSFFSSFKLYKRFLRTKNKGEGKKETEIDRFLKSKWYKIGHYSSKYAAIVILVVLIIAIPVSINVANLNTTLDLNQIYPRSSESRQAFIELEKDFPAGELMPHYLIIQTGTPNGLLNSSFFTYSQEIIQSICDQTNMSSTNIQGITWADGMAIPFPLAISYLSPESPYYNTNMGFLYRLIFNRYTNADNSTALFEIDTEIDPFGNKIEDWVKVVRQILASFEQKTGYKLYIAGGSTEMIDSINRIYELFPMMIVITIIIIYVLIAFMFRSFFIPLRLILTIALTLSWIYGLAVLLFEYDFFDPVFPALQEVNSLYWIVPIMSFSILIGLGLDYDIFLLSRISEYRDLGFNDRASILRGLYKTGGIITAAGIIMAISFSGLLLSTEMVMNQFGFMLCVAVLIDTFIIRTILVPAIMSVAEKWNWWPSKKPEPIKGELDPE